MSAAKAAELAELLERIEALESRVRALSAALAASYSYASIPLPAAVGGKEPARDRSHLEVIR